MLVYEYYKANVVFEVQWKLRLFDLNDPLSVCRSRAIYLNFNGYHIFLLHGKCSHGRRLWQWRLPKSIKVPSNIPSKLQAISWWHFSTGIRKRLGKSNTYTEILCNNYHMVLLGSQYIFHDDSPYELLNRWSQSDLW